MPQLWHAAAGMTFAATQQGTTVCTDLLCEDRVGHLAINTLLTITLYVPSVTQGAIAIRVLCRAVSQ